MMKIPAHPTGATCETCSHWFSLQREKVMLQPNPMTGQVTPISLSELLKTGGAIDKNMVVDIAPCTLHPMWGPTFQKHWCGQHPKIITDTFKRHMNLRYGKLGLPHIDGPPLSDDNK